WAESVHGVGGLRGVVHSVGPIYEEGVCQAVLRKDDNLEFGARWTRGWVAEPTDGLPGCARARELHNGRRLRTCRQMIPSDELHTSRWRVHVGQPARLVVSLLLGERHGTSIEVELGDPIAGTVGHRVRRV